MELCLNLINWLKTFDVCPQSATLGNLTDGVVVAQVLHQISSSFFSENWLSKIKLNCLLDKRIKASNLKKVVRRVTEYFNEVLKRDLSESFVPDVAAIVENQDAVEMGRLLKLVVCCAVESDDRHEYISRITSLDESIQVAIMKSIQEFLKVEFSSEHSKSMQTRSLIAQLQKANEEIRSLLKEKEMLMHKCDVTEHGLNLALEEKSTLESHIEELNVQLEQAENLEGTSSAAGRRYQQVLSQLEKLKEELFQMENGKQDVQTYCNQLKEELNELQQKNDQLGFENNEVNELRDEVDQLRSVAEKLRKSEAQIEIYKKRQDKFDDLKIELKLLEESNSQHLEGQQQLEQEVKRLKISTVQMDGMKKQMQDLRTRLEEKQSSGDQTEIESRRFKEKVTALTREKQALVEERNSLVESLEDMKLQRSCQTAMFGEDVRNIQPATPGVKLLALPMEVREKVFSLEQENKKLKLQLTSQDSDLQLHAQLDESNAEKAELETKLRNLSYRLLELESKSNCVGEPESRATAEEVANCALRQKLAEQVQRCRMLEEELQKVKEQASKLQLVDLKMRKWKAELSSEAPTPNWRLLLEHRDKFAQDLESRLQEEKTLHEKEEKLIVTAWYNLGQRLQKKSALSRLSSRAICQTFSLEKEPTNAQINQVLHSDEQPESSEHLGTFVTAGPVYE